MSNITQIYLLCSITAVLGWFIQAMLKVKSISEKARLSNVQFSSLEYFKEDAVSHTLSLATIGLTIMFVGYFIDQNYNKYMIMLLTATSGYTGADIWSRVFSVVNKRINAAIDYKTTIADTANNTLDKPTPAK